MSEIIKVYLAGNLRMGWRRVVIEECSDLPIVFLSPVEIPKNGPYYQAPATELMRTYKTTDFMKLDRSDLIFAYMCEDPTTRYAGTSAEISRAHSQDKSIILVNNLDDVEYDKYRFVMALADYNIRELDLGIDILRKIAIDMIYQVRSFTPPVPLFQELAEIEDAK